MDDSLKEHVDARLNNFVARLKDVAAGIQEVRVELTATEVETMGEALLPAACERPASSPTILPGRHGEVEKRLAEIEARERAATPGPWKDYLGTVAQGRPATHSRLFGERHPQSAALLPDDVPATADRVARIVGPGDAAFIAAARDDVPWLVAELRAAREALEASEREGCFCNHCDGKECASCLASKALAGLGGGEVRT